MYKQTTTPAIVLKRVNYSDADKIITFLTPKGKLTAMVKGVRRQGSKLAGGIELFSVAQITSLDTRGDMGRVVSSKLVNYYSKIVSNLERMMFAYECLSQIAKITPDQTDDDNYFVNTVVMLESVNNLTIPIPTINFWWQLRIMNLNGQQLNLQTDNADMPLVAGTNYRFGIDTPVLMSDENGPIREEHIKMLRFATVSKPTDIYKIKDSQPLIKELTLELKQITDSL